MTTRIIIGNLLDTPETYVGHQCNCVSIGQAAGLAKAIFKKFPFADAYAKRTVPATPGSYSLHGNGKNLRYLINFYAQYFPGKSRKRMDTSEARLTWLTGGITGFVREYRPSEIALPYGIGCGLAGGDQAAYLDALENVSKSESFNINFYKLNE